MSASEATEWDEDEAVEVPRPTSERAQQETDDQFWGHLVEQPTTEPADATSTDEKHFVPESSHEIPSAAAFDISEAAQLTLTDTSVQGASSSSDKTERPSTNDSTPESVVSGKLNADARPGEGEESKVAPTLDHVLGVRSESAEVSDRSTQNPFEGDHLADLVDDPRDRALEGYELDRESAGQAADLGHKLAERDFVDHWERGTPSDRIYLSLEVREMAGNSLDIKALPLSFSDDMGGDLGQTTPEGVKLNADLLEASDCTEAVRTVAHEYRHQWQAEVIEGSRLHPEGLSARMELMKAAENYQADRQLLDSYLNNEMELDGEAFARAVTRAYNGDRDD